MKFKTYLFIIIFIIIKFNIVCAQDVCRDISGVVSLPNSYTANENINITIYAWTSNDSYYDFRSNVAYSTNIAICKNTNSASYTLTVKENINNSESIGYIIQCLITDENSDYHKNVYFSNLGTVYNLSSASKINIFGSSVENKNITLVTKDSVIDDSSNTLSNAISINSPSENNCTINYSNDIDYFSFTPTKSSEYTIKTLGNIDTVGSLLDSSGKEIFYDDDSGDGTNFLLNVNLFKYQTYFIKIKEINAGVGNYNLSLSENSNVDPMGLLISNNNNIITIDGQNLIIGNNFITIKITNSKNEIKFVGQTIPNPSGEFRFEFVNTESYRNDLFKIYITGTASPKVYEYSFYYVSDWNGKLGNEITFLNESGQILNNLIPNQNLYVRAKLFNNTMTDKDVILIVVLYKDGNQINLKTINNSTVKALCEEDVNLNLFIPSNNQNGKLKVFLWESLFNQIPYIMPKTLN